MGGISSAALVLHSLCTREILGRGFLIFPLSSCFLGFPSRLKFPSACIFSAPPSNAPVFYVLQSMRNHNSSKPSECRSPAGLPWLCWRGCSAESFCPQKESVEKQQDAKCCTQSSWEGEIHSLGLKVDPSTLECYQAEEKKIYKNLNFLF